MAENEKEERNKVFEEGNKVLVDLNRSNPLTVIWDALVGQIIQTLKKEI